MQNTKLLDLQTGKYLELGKDFWYGGDSIKLNEKKLIRNYQSGVFDKEYSIVSQTIIEISEPQEPLKTLYEKTGAVVYGGRYVLMESQNITQGIGYVMSRHTTYQKNISVGDIHLCAGSYQIKHIDFNEIDNYTHNRLRFSINEQGQNIIEAILEAKYEPFVFINSTKNNTMSQLTFESKRGTAIASVFGQSAIMEFLGNIFEEYSKQLRNEPNKFEELMELIK